MQPTHKIIFDAEELYEKILFEYRFCPWFNNRVAIQYLIQNKVWPHDGNKQLRELDKQIDKQKFNLFQALYASEEQKRIRRLLKNLKKQYDALFQKKYCIFDSTLEGYAQKVYDEFILINTIVDENDEKIWDSFDSVDYKLFSEIRSIIFKQNINVSSIRELARTDPWKSYWGIYKPNVFKPPLNDEQKALLLFSQMYENAYSHPECPNNKVINDDDMFDGWIIHQRKKREEQLKESNLQQVDELHKHGDAQEIMLMAKSKDDVSKIQDMNHPVSRAAVRSRQKVIKQKGTATDLDFPDVKQDVAILKAQAAKQVRSRKG